VRLTKVRVVRTCNKGATTMSISMIGLDTAKSVFQIHGLNKTGKVEIKHKLRRSELIAFFQKKEICTGLRCTDIMSDLPGVYSLRLPR
jgi:hypothetical protein